MPQPIKYGAPRIKAHLAALGWHVTHWPAMLAIGLAAMAYAAAIAYIEARLRIDRPLAAPDWIAHQERAIHRMLRPAKRGRKPRQRQDGDSLA